MYRRCETPRQLHSELLAWQNHISESITRAGKLPHLVVMHSELASLISAIEASYPDAALRLSKKQRLESQIRKLQFELDNLNI